MWSEDHEEEIRANWIHAGPEDRAVGTMAARRTDEVYNGNTFPLNWSCSSMEAA